MNTRRQLNEGGSILTFVIVALVLVGLVIGGIVAVRQFGEDVRFAGNDTPVALEEESDDDPMFEMDPEPEAETDERSSDDEPVVSDDEQARNDRDEDENRSDDVAVTDTPDEMPETGPAEALGTFMVLALLTFTAASYVRSRKIHEN